MNVLSDADLAKYDIFVFTETWETHPLTMPRLHVIQSFARKTEGPGRPSGGVAVFYNNKLTNATCECAEDDIVVLNCDNCVIIAMYINPSTPLSTFEDKLAHVASWIRSDVPTVLCGDLNAPVDKPDSKRTRSLLQAFETWGLSLITEQHIPTFVAHQGRSTIDIIATNGSAHYNGLQSDLPVFGTTAHLPVAMTFQLMKTSTKLKKKRPHTMLSQEALLEGLITMPTPNLTSVEGIGDSYGDLVRVLTGSIMPKRQRQSKPWFDAECFRAFSELRRIALACSHEGNRPIELKTSRTYYKGLLIRKKMDYRLKQEAKIVEQSRAKPYLWLRDGNRTRPCQIPSTTLNAHFSQMYSSNDTTPKETPLVVTVRTIGDQIEHDVLNSDWSVMEVVDAVTALPKHKAPGPDGVLNEHLQQ